MQVRAIFEAACQCAKEGVDVHPEVMIPLVSHVNELKVQQRRSKTVAKAVMEEQGIDDRLQVRHDDRDPARGPDRRRDRRVRPVLLLRHQRPDADDLRHLAATMPRRFLLEYLEKGILPDNPFATHRPERASAADGDGGQNGPQDPAGSGGRHLRRARRRSESIDSATRSASTTSPARRSGYPRPPGRRPGRDQGAGIHREVNRGRCRAFRSSPTAWCRRSPPARLSSGPRRCVKELVENALDAGATRSTFDLEGAGGGSSPSPTTVRHGRRRRGARLCPPRHQQDFLRRRPLRHRHPGFRGEALATIAAVAKVELTTAMAPGEGTRVLLEGGRILAVEPTARTRGTTIHVASLFFENVPARRKFSQVARDRIAALRRGGRRLRPCPAGRFFSFEKRRPRSVGDGRPGVRR